MMVMVVAEGTVALTPKKLRSLKRKHPAFFRQNFGRKERKRVKEGWRKPRGVDNKKREKIATFGAEPNIGYRNPRIIRGLHPCGKQEVRVFNAGMLSSVPKNAVVRIAGSVGEKKRVEIRNKAKELGITVLN